MTPDEKAVLVNEICEGVFCRLQEHRRIAGEQHRRDHDFVAYLREQKERRTATWENIKRTAIGAITVALLSAIGSGLYWVGSLVLEALRKHN